MFRSLVTDSAALPVEVDGLHPVDEVHAIRVPREGLDA
ncbi:hypothetical protein chiPu_0033744, partial [Chiloscyllium punctatum]|nr:hypothetical protein [Chiloscyllium punctatum]